MNALQEIIKIMSEADRKAFLVYMTKKNKREDVRNITLFKYLETDDINLQKKLYNDSSPDALHALRKRLYNSLIAFLGNRKFTTDTSATHEAESLLVVAKYFFEHKLYKEGFKCLEKAENTAIALEDFKLLNDIYHTRIQFAHYNSLVDLEAAIGLFNVNKEKMGQDEQMNIAYALLRRELAAIYHQGKVIDFTAFVQETMEQQGVSSTAITFRSLYQILFIANEYASLNNDYGLVRPFMDSAYNFVLKKENLADKHLYYHIYILYLLANMHFRNRNFNESEHLLEKMEQQMQKQGGRYYSRFAMRHNLLLALTKNYSGSPGLATGIAEKALKVHKDADVSDVNDMQLCLLVFYLQHTDRSAFKLLSRFNRTDSWYEKKMGMDWAIKKKLVEVLLHVEFDNAEVALNQLKSFRKRYKNYLTEVNEDRVLAYTTILNTYIIKPETFYANSNSAALQQITSLSGIGGEDVFVLSFIGWLKAKVDKKPTYETILSLIPNS